MSLPGPEDFARRFAAAFSARDAVAIGALCTEGAGALTLTGGWADDRTGVQALWAADLAGPLAGTRLVTGKMRLVPVAEGAVMLHQRFVLSGVTDANGGDLGRLGVMLCALLLRQDADWKAQSLMIAPLA